MELIVNTHDRKQKKSHARSLFWGIVLIAAAILLLLDGLHIFTFDTLGLTPFRLFLVVLCAGWLIWELVRLKLSIIFLPMGLLFLLLEAPIAYSLGYENGDIINNWIVILVVLLLTVGLHCVLPKRVGGKKKLSMMGDFNKCGSSDLYFDSADLSDARISDIVGNVNVFFSNQENYPGDQTVYISDIAGRVKIHLPQTWLVITHVSDCVGCAKVPPQAEGTYEKSITLEITDIVGRVEVVFD